MVQAAQRCRFAGSFPAEWTNRAGWVGQTTNWEASLKLKVLLKNAYFVA